MLSILIPIYNFDITELVHELHRQALNLHINFEIILVDDFSSDYKEKNKKLTGLSKVVYSELSENYGRAKIRNYLASKAKYENLIFLDCDSLIENKYFLKNYLDNLQYDIISGGRLYSKLPPEREEYYLHWLYGTKTESLALSERLKNPNKSFKTNNFLIKKYIFQKVKFNENITQYGHEDTLFGYDLIKNGYKIHHIDNPIVHIGLEGNKIFIEKTILSVKNLTELFYSNKFSKEFFKDIKLLKYFFILKKYYLCLPFYIVKKVFNGLVIRNLLSQKPKLFMLDILKLTIICNLKKSSFN